MRVTPNLERVDVKGGKQSVSGPGPVTCTCSWTDLDLDLDLDLAGLLAAFRRWSMVDGRW